MNVPFDHKSVEMGQPAPIQLEAITVSVLMAILDMTAQKILMIAWALLA